MTRIQWNDDRTLSVDPPKRPKKLTGTRFAAVLGLNRWTTDFQVWCEVTKTYSKPFEDTVYTLAGKAIEPKQIAYMREAYGMDDLRDPTDVYGKDYFKKTYGNFFTDPVLGGMWDALLVDDDEAPTAVLEFKTTKRAEDWAEDVPEYYALQAALYAYLLGVEDVIMVATFLQDGDYEKPEDFVVTAENTATFEFRVHDRYPDFEGDYVQPALAWWNEYVETGNSPEYDEKLDSDYLKALRNASLSPESEVDAMLAEYERLADEVEAFTAPLKAKQKRMDAIKKQLKQYAEENIGDSDTATFEHGRVTCKLSRSTSMRVDEKALEKAGILEKYQKEVETSRFTVTLAKQ